MKFPNGFWGLEIEPGLTYSQTVQNNFKIYMAALVLEESEDDLRTTLFIEANNKKFVLCNLISGVHEQQNLNITLLKDEEIKLYSIGHNKIHLTGNYIKIIDYDDSESELEELSNQITSKANGKMDKRIQNFDDEFYESSEEDYDAKINVEDDSDGDFIEEDNLLDQLFGKKAKNEGQKRTNEDSNDKLKAPTAKKQKTENGSIEPKNGSIEPNNADVLSKAQKKKKNKKQKAKTETLTKALEPEKLKSYGSDKNAESEKPKAESSNKNSESEKPKTNDSNKKAVSEKPKTEISNKNAETEKLKTEGKNKNTETKNKDSKLGSGSKEKKEIITTPEGIVIEELTLGTGKIAKPGKKLNVRYIGQLTNGKVFDKNVGGKPFHFTLGKGEVIKGWDAGIDGMRIGGERRLTIPPQQAYGSAGSPPAIPKNATLVFKIKLLGVN